VGTVEPQFPVVVLEEQDHTPREAVAWFCTLATQYGVSGDSAGQEPMGIVRKPAPQLVALEKV
jgi:hypothetical protein